MTPWEVVGLCLLLAPFLFMMAVMIADDPEAFIIGLILLVLICAPIIVGALLFTGEWAP